MKPFKHYTTLLRTATLAAANSLNSIFDNDSHKIVSARGKDVLAKLQKLKEDGISYDDKSLMFLIEHDEIFNDILDVRKYVDEYVGAAEISLELWESNEDYFVINIGTDLSGKEAFKREIDLFNGWFDKIFTKHNQVVATRVNGIYQ